MVFMAVAGLLRGIKPPRAESGEFLVFVFLAVLTLGFFALGTFGFKNNEKGAQSRFGLCAHFGSSIPRIEKKTNASNPRETAITTNLAAASAVALTTER